MVGNFHKVLIFAFFMSRNSGKLKPQNLLMCKVSESDLNLAYTSNYLTVLTPTKVCQQVCLWRLSLKFYISLDGGTRQRGEAIANFYEHPWFSCHTGINS